MCLGLQILNHYVYAVGSENVIFTFFLASGFKHHFHSYKGTISDISHLKLVWRLIGFIPCMGLFSAIITVAMATLFLIRTYKSFACSTV